MAKQDRVPKYRRHSSGQAFVEFQGKRHYLGPYSTPESRAQYQGFVDAFKQSQLAAARLLGDQSPHDLLVKELILAFLEHAETYYRKNDKPTSELYNLKPALRTLRELFGEEEVRIFSPPKLKAVRQSMLGKNLARKTINQRINQIKRAFAWGVEEELVPPSVWHSLLVVKGLKRGRSTAKETKPVRPIDCETVEATIPYLPPVVVDMVKFQRLTGSRPSEVCELRPVDVERGTDPWVYRPATHKTQHHGKERVIFIGPKAQDILAPYLLRPADAHCFSPADSERKRLELRHADRKTPITPSQRKRALRSNGAAAGTKYDKDSYGKAVRRAISKANHELKAAASEPGLFPDDRQSIEKWTPNRLRHSTATEVRRRFGAEAAQVVLGHSELVTTEIYAERDLAKAAAVMRQIG